MAVMVPEGFPKRMKQPGERRVYELLRDALPASFRAWYEPMIGKRRRRPDFVLLAPDFGLLVLEVKDWRADGIHSVSNEKVHYESNENGKAKLKPRDNPLRQVDGYMFELVNELNKMEILLHASGPHEGKLCFPYASGVVFSNITRAQWEKIGCAQIFSQDVALCSDELLALRKTGDEEKTVSRFQQLFTNSFAFDALNEEQLDTVHGTIHPEVVVQRKPARQAPLPNVGARKRRHETLAVLDLQQERIAKDLGSGHRVFFGVAGSGKTILLLARAKLLAEHGQHKRILLLCFNQALAAWLKTQFQDRKIEVEFFNSWIRSYGPELHMTSSEQRTKNWDGYNARIAEIGARIVRDAPVEKKYDAILIDEAQDFWHGWFASCVQALRDPENGDLVIAVDGAQSLYRRPRGETWKSVGVNAVGRSKRLTSNYRNTSEILEFAWCVTQERVEFADTETSVRVAPEEIERSGPKPRYFEAKNDDEEQRAVLREIRTFQKLKISDKEIAVLYARGGNYRIVRLVDFLEKAGVSVSRIDMDKASFVSRPGVRLSTVRSAKGMGFAAVVLYALDQFSADIEDTGDTNLFYVGLTRARERLLVTWRGASEFTRRVKQDAGVERAEDLI